MLVISSSILLLLLIDTFRHGHGIHHDHQPASQRLNHDIAQKDIILLGFDDDLAYNLTAFTTSPRSALSKRDNYWDNVVCRGETALNRILHEPPSTQVWTQRDFSRYWDSDNHDFNPSEGIHGALDALGIPKENDPDVTFYLEADQSFEFRAQHGRMEPATGEFYYQTYIPSSGTIIGHANYSPQHQALPGAALPPLWRWSDVTWLLWSQKAGVRANRLRQIIHETITTPSTRELMEYIEVAEPDDLDLPYPGTLYDLRTEDAKALLGSPHGVGISYLLRDHRNVLGMRYPAVRIWTARNTVPLLDQKFNYFMLWYLRNTVQGPN
ncbi:MAG: hypothetical protein Q9225_001175 [Loekoesia sp. 1 TL-2023]